MKSPEKVRRLRAGLSWLSLIPDLILTVALSLGWFIRWNIYGHTVLLLIGACGLLLISLNLFLHYYYRIRVLTSIFRLWVGCLLGVISLFDVSPNLQHSYAGLEDVVNLLLISSVISQSLVQSVSKCCRSLPENSLWSEQEFFEFLGVSVSCLIAGPNSLPLLCLLLSFATVITAIKLGSWSSCVTLSLLIFTSNKYLLPELQMSVNPYGIITFVARGCLSPLLELLLNSQGRMDKWMAPILAAKWRHQLGFAVVTSLEITVFCTHAAVVKNHKEWYVVVPLFVLASILWIVMHLVFIVICGTLLRRVSSCREYANSVLTLKKALSARGLRYFSLIAQRLMSVCIVSSCLIGVLCWTTRTAYNFSLMACVLALEAIVGELLLEFSNSLGGTCIGYGIVAPAVNIRSDSPVTLLPRNFIQEASTRSTKILQTVLDLFAQHMVTNFGCDWSMGGLASDGLEKKLTEFFSQTTNEGPRYDTYLLYFSGPTNLTGDWALTGETSFSFSRLQELWFDQNTKSSRLLIICDTENSHHWLKPVWRTKGYGNYIALQTFCYQKSVKIDPELCLNVGEFTEFYVDFNGVIGNSQTQIDSQTKTFRPLYAVSRHWTDFNFHLPSTTDISDYWMSSLPRITHPVMGVVVAILAARLPLCGCCECCSKLMKRSRIKLWPPVQLDTGHGFRLLRC